jgi:hypothetical protein
VKKVAVAGVILVVVLYGVARSVPIEPQEQRPGLKLGGEPAAEQDTDWAFYTGPKKIWVQTRTWYGIPHSVTTTSFVVDGALYVPCRDCETKRWPKNVARDPRVRLKIDGKLYERTAVPISDEAERARLVLQLAGEARPNVAVFRMDPS